MKEEFKTFVRTKPELISYVNDGSMTWQKFYELWSLYGPDNNIWDKYTKKQETALNISTITDMLKKVDKDTIQKGINNVQKIIELLQGFVAKDSVKTSSYEPRRLFKKFED